MNAAQNEPPPKTGHSDIYPLVMADIQARVDAGKRKYGTVLQADNGRDALMDAYQEAIDLVMYLRQAIEERTKPLLTLAYLSLLEREIVWCEKNPDKAFTADYRKGFVNGLVQARILIANADKVSRERPGERGK